MLSGLHGVWANNVQLVKVFQVRKVLQKVHTSFDLCQ